MKASSILLTAAFLTTAYTSYGVKPIHADTTLIPQRAFIITGEVPPSGNDQVAILYSREDLSFNDPSAPRFLFLDRQGKVAMGIGGKVKVMGMYDMNGAINSNGFAVYDIPTPANPSQRQRLGADASQSSIFLKMAANTDHFGQVIVYIESNFTGNNDGYGMTLQKAYVTAGHFTAGKARSTFIDAESQAPVIDSYGPSGKMDTKNILVRYKSSNYHGFSFAASVEMPQATYTLGSQTEKIAQRFPDIPVYVQYAWGQENENHIRLSGIVRELSYRDLLSSQNHLVNGWGVHLSSVSTIAGPLGYYAHVAYGKGIATYMNDLAGHGLDLVAAGPGELKAPRNLAWGGGLTLQPTRQWLLSTSYSQCSNFDRYSMGTDSYRYAQYFNVNCYYTIGHDLQIGAEYLWGRRVNYDNISGHANRLLACVQYNF